MKALILRQNTEAACALSKVLIDKGFQILCAETLAVAHALIRVDTIDLLVMDESFEGQLTHSIALSGERRSPMMSVIMLTDRDRSEVDDLYELIPCLYALAGVDLSPHILGQLALAAISVPQDAIARVKQETLVLTDVVAPTADVMPDALEVPMPPIHADVALVEPAMTHAMRAQSYEPRMHLTEVIDAEVAAMTRAHPFQRMATTPLTSEMA